MLACTPAGPCIGAETPAWGAVPAARAEVADGTADCCSAAPLLESAPFRPAAFAGIQTLSLEMLLSCCASALLICCRRAAFACSSWRSFWPACPRTAAEADKPSALRPFPSMPAAAARSARISMPACSRIVSHRPMFSTRSSRTNPGISEVPRLPIMMSHLSSALPSGLTTQAAVSPSRSCPVLACPVSGSDTAHSQFPSSRWI